jgi:hypothetical protein
MNVIKVEPDSDNETTHTLNDNQPTQEDHSLAVTFPALEMEVTAKVNRASTFISHYSIGGDVLNIAC